MTVNYLNSYSQHLASLFHFDSITANRDWDPSAGKGSLVDILCLIPFLQNDYMV